MIEVFFKVTHITLHEYHHIFIFRERLILEALIINFLIICFIIIILFVSDHVAP